MFDLVVGIIISAATNDFWAYAKFYVGAWSFNTHEDGVKGLVGYLGASADEKWIVEHESSTAGGVFARSASGKFFGLGQLSLDLRIDYYGRIGYDDPISQDSLEKTNPFVQFIMMRVYIFERYETAANAKAHKLSTVSEGNPMGWY